MGSPNESPRRSASTSAANWAIRVARDAAGSAARGPGVGSRSSSFDRQSRPRRCCAPGGLEAAHGRAWSSVKRRPWHADERTGDHVQPETPDERNVLGGPLQPCGIDPVTGFYRDGACSSGPEDLGSHTVCAVVAPSSSTLQRDLGNDLSHPAPEYRFPGLRPGDRWCVVAVRWLQALPGGRGCRRGPGGDQRRAALESCRSRPRRQYAVDVPDDISRDWRDGATRSAACPWPTTSGRSPGMRACWARY